MDPSLKIILAFIILVVSGAAISWKLGVFEQDNEGGNNEGGNNEGGNNEGGNNEEEIQEPSCSEVCRYHHTDTEDLPNRGYGRIGYPIPDGAQGPGDALELCNQYCFLGFRHPCVPKIHRIGQQEHTFYECGLVEEARGENHKRDPQYIPRGNSEMNIHTTTYWTENQDNTSFGSCTEYCNISG